MFGWLKRSPKQPPSEESGFILGYAFSFTNETLGLDYEGLGFEIVAQMRDDGQDPSFIANHMDTAIAVSEVLQEQPVLEFSGGPIKQHSRRDGGTVSRASTLLPSSSPGRTSPQFPRPLIMTNDRWNAPSKRSGAAATQAPRVKLLSSGARASVRRRPRRWRETRRFPPPIRRRAPSPGRERPRSSGRASSPLPFGAWRG